MAARASTSNAAAASIDDLVTASADANGSVEAVQQQVVPLLRKIVRGAGEGRRNSLGDKLANGTDPLEALSAESDTLCFVCIINARMRASDSVGHVNQLVAVLESEASNLDVTQLRLMPEQVRHLGDAVSRFAELTGEYTRVKALVARLIDVVAPSRTTLTSLHAIFLKLALASHSVEDTVDMLLDGIDDIDTVCTAVKYHDNLLYHYYGGIILSLLGHFRAAENSLEIVLSAPGPAISAIQLDAYKKLVLLQLLTHGRKLPSNKFVSNDVLSAVAKTCGVYNDYASAYEALDDARLRNVFVRNQQVFEEDLNGGLVELCNSRFHDRAIRRLGGIFVTMGLAEIASQVHKNVDGPTLEGLSARIQELIRSRQLDAQISPSNAAGDPSGVVVTFLSDSSTLVTHAPGGVGAAHTKAASLRSALVAQDLALASSPAFVQQAVQATQHSAVPANMMDAEEEVASMSSKYWAM